MQNEPEQKNIYQGIEQLFETLCNDYEQKYQQYKNAKTQNEHRMKRKDELLKENKELKERVLGALEKIKKYKQKNIQSNIAKLQNLQKNETKRSQQFNALKNIPYFYQIPEVKMNLKSIQLPEGIKCLERKMQQEFQQQKQTLKDEITKLKIMIKLSEIDLEDIQSQASKKGEHL